MSDYIFIDQHLHTILSDEELCDESPEHILNKVQAYADKFNSANGTNKKCLITFADHNTILSSVEAQRLLKTGLYPNVEYVNGCEFTIDLCELASLYGGKKLFTRCHMHGFNYNEKDPELLAYSKITHLHFSKEDNIGMQICATRREINETLNINIPFLTYLPLTTLNGYSDYAGEFYECFKQYCNKNNIKYNPNEIKSIINTYIISDASKSNKTIRYNLKYNPEAMGRGRLKLSEAVKMVKNAGGEVVIAHPSLISVNASMIPKIVAKHGGNEREATAEVIRVNKRNKKTIEIMRCPYAKLMLNELLDASEKICRTKINGFETYYSLNFVNRVDKAIHEICKAREMIETCGSDYHGENFPSHKTIGLTFQHPVQNAYINLTGKIKMKELYLRVSNLSGVEHFVSHVPINQTKPAVFIDDKNQIIKWETIDELIDQVNKTNVKSSAEKANPFASTKSNTINNMLFGDRINNLLRVEAMFDELLDRMKFGKDYIKLLLRLDKFACSIYDGIKKMEKIVRDKGDMLDPEIYKQIITVTKHIHTKYLTLTQKDPKLMDRLQKQKLKRYGKGKTYIDKLSNITITEK